MANTHAAQQLLDQINAAQVASGLSRPDYFAQLAKAHPDLVQAYAQGTLDTWMAQQPQPGWQQYLPFILGGAGLAASFIPAAAAGGAAAGSGGALATSVPGSFASGAYGAGAFGVPGGTAAGVAAGTGGLAAALPTAANAATAGGGIGASLAKFAKNPADIAKILAAVPAIKTLMGDGSNGNSPFAADSPLMKSAQTSLDMGNKRMEQAQPVYDTMVNMAYGRTPTRYRGAPPAGYSGDAAPAGAYQYTAPKFG